LRIAGTLAVTAQSPKEINVEPVVQDDLARSSSLTSPD
jgi:hypothetical protein